MQKQLRELHRHEIHQQRETSSKDRRNFSSGLGEGTGRQLGVCTGHVVRSAPPQLKKGNGTYFFQRNQPTRTQSCISGISSGS
jgi:hypothetical protein